MGGIEEERRAELIEPDASLGPNGAERDSALELAAEFDGQVIFPAEADGRRPEAGFVPGVWKPARGPGDELGVGDMWANELDDGRVEKNVETSLGEETTRGGKNGQPDDCVAEVAGEGDEYGA